MERERISISTYQPYMDFHARVSERYGNKSLRILDIGSGNGAFIDACVARGHDILGIEYDTRFIGLMPEETAARVIFEPVERALPLVGEFDIITFWDSFEHLRNPFRLLVELAAHLAPRGIVFLRVNNTRDIFNFITLLALRLNVPAADRLLKTCFNLPQHYWNFSQESMVRLLQALDWNVVEFRVTETPVERLFDARFLQLAAQVAYGFNRLVNGGKIGEYHIQPKS